MKKQVIYIEDDAAVSGLTQIILGLILGDEYELQVFDDMPSGDACMMTVESDARPALIITDCNLPSIDLCETDCIYHVSEDIPIILVTGNAWDKPLSPNMQVCNKPYSVADFAAAVNKGLGRTDATK